MKSISMLIKIPDDHVDHTLAHIFFSELDQEKSGLTPKQMYDRLKLAFPPSEGYWIDCEQNGVGFPIFFEDDVFIQPPSVLIEA